MSSEEFKKLEELLANDRKIIEEKNKEIERLKNGCEELEQQIDDLHKLETTITNENERLNNKIEELFLDLQDTNSQLADVSKRCIKAIKYIEDMQKSPSYCDTWSTTAPHDIICILKGEDKQ